MFVMSLFDYSGVQGIFGAKFQVSEEWSTLMVLEGSLWRFSFGACSGYVFPKASEP